MLNVQWHSFPFTLNLIKNHFDLFFISQIKYPFMYFMKIPGFCDGNICTFVVLRICIRYKSVFISVAIKNYIAMWLMLNLAESSHK